MLAAMPQTKYRDNEILLGKGDSIILYTDGITEACNPSLELYGEPRLEQSILQSISAQATQTLEALSQSVQDFECGAEQADDKTALVLYNMMDIQSFKTPAEPSSTAKVLEFVENSFQGKGISPKWVQKFLICTDEIYSNILQYSRATEIEILCKVLEHQISLKFLDDGIPYNPLEREEPDTALPAEERLPGGYGIFIVKKLMTQVEYRYVERRNSLELILKLEE